MSYTWPMQRPRGTPARARVRVAKGGGGRVAECGGRGWSGRGFGRAAWVTLVVWSVVWMLPGVHAVLSHGGAHGGAHGGSHGAGSREASAVTSMPSCTAGRSPGDRASADEVARGHGHDHGFALHTGHGHEHDRPGRDAPAPHSHREGGEECSTCVLLACLISPAGPPCAGVVATVDVVGVVAGNHPRTSECGSVPEGLLMHGPPTRCAALVA